jgi:hypothetical protein
MLLFIYILGYFMFRCTIGTVGDDDGYYRDR